MSAERLHHPHSPSSLQAKEACPKYANAFNTSEAAEIGTRQHTSAETETDDESLPDDKAAAVADVLSFCQERASMYPEHLLLKEEYFPVSDDTVYDSKGNKFQGITGGYLDVAIVSKDRKVAEILDHKFGKNAVEKADTNLQGIAYALGVVRRFPTIEKVFVWFLMPHLDWVTGTEFTKDQFPALELRVRTVVSRAIEANRDSNDFSMALPNQSGCMWCAHLGRCPKVAEIALRVGKKYAPLDIPESISTVVFEDPAQVGTGIKLAAVIKAWAEAYRTQATAKSIESDFIPAGYTLVSTTKRKVIDAHRFGEVAKSMLPESDHGKVDALFDLPLGAVEKLIENSAPRGMKKKKSEELGEKALAVSALEMGKPFAFLRQNNTKE